MTGPPPPEPPWYNDSDKVSGLAATIVLLAFTICISMGAVWATGKLLFGW